MSRSKEALKMAHGWLIDHAEHDPICDVFYLDEDCKHKPCSCGLDSVMTSIREALAEQEQEPLFWYRPRSDGGFEGPIHNDKIEDVRKNSGAWYPLCTNPAPSQQAMDAQEVIRKAADRFLGWKLPEDFYPDNFITHDRAKHNAWGGYPNSWPTGTNLLTSDQAKAMFEHCFDGLLSAAPQAPAPLCKHCRDELSGHKLDGAACGDCTHVLEQQAQAPAPANQPSVPSQKSECDCGCNDPCFTTSWEAITFLSNRFKHAGVSEAVARKYARDLDKIIAAAPANQQAVGVPDGWKHDCAALCSNDVELWVDSCPHCGKPRSAAPEAPAHINCKAKRENGGVCPHHNLQCGWPKCNEAPAPAWQELSRQDVDDLIAQHVDPVATYRKLHDYAGAISAALRAKNGGGK